MIEETPLTLAQVQQIVRNAQKGTDRIIRMTEDISGQDFGELIHLPGIPEDAHIQITRVEDTNDIIHIQIFL
jgi:hypothetical protein